MITLENKMQKNKSEIENIVRKIREDIFFQREFELPEGFSINTILNEENLFKYKSIELNIQNIQQNYKLVNFSYDKDFPKFHVDTKLILQEFSTKFSEIRSLEHGLYNLIPRYETKGGIPIYDYNNVKDAVLRMILLFVKSDRQTSAVKTNVVEAEFLNYFIELYRDYSFPQLDSFGNYNFDTPLNHIENLFSFYVPCSHHDLLKGLETNYI